MSAVYPQQRLLNRIASLEDQVRMLETENSVLRTEKQRLAAAFEELRAKTDRN